MGRVVIIFLTVVLLAVFCLGATFLAACRIEEPQLYESIVTPIRETAAAVGDRAGRWLAAAEDTAVDLFQETAALADQVAGRMTDTLDTLDTAILNANSTVGNSVTSLVASLSIPDPAEDPQQIATQPSIVHQADIADPVITELVTRNAQEYLSGGNLDIPYYNQGDPAWAELPYGSDKIGTHGCGPSALAMVLSALTGETIDPSYTATWAVENGYWAPHNGSYLSIVQGAAESFGLQCTSLGVLTAENLYDTLALGNSLVVALMGPGHFTQNGHFIILRGATLEGDLLIADPNSRENSLTLWNPQVIVNELSTSRSNGAPLWLLTKPETMEETEDPESPDSSAENLTA